MDACLDYGVDLSGHRSRPVTPELAASADRVYCMAGHHAEALGEIAPGVRSRVRLLDPDGDVADPVGGPLQQYRETAWRLQNRISRLDEEDWP